MTLLASLTALDLLAGALALGVVVLLALDWRAVLREDREHAARMRRPLGQVLQFPSREQLKLPRRRS